MCSLISCANGGTCNNGVCACEVGYAGTHCTEETDPNPGQNQVDDPKEVKSDDGVSANTCFVFAEPHRDEGDM